MKLKAPTPQPITVQFRDSEGETQELKILVNCLTPRKFYKLQEDLAAISQDFQKTAEVISATVTGWQGVVDEAGNDVPFTQERFQDVLMGHFGLLEMVTQAIGEGVMEQRKKTLLGSDASLVSEPVETSMTPTPSSNQLTA